MHTAALPRLQFRLATLDDTELLLRWRNHPETRKYLFHSEETTFEDHSAWLIATLANPSRQLFVAEVGGTPVGTFRADLAPDGCYELSWTVSPDIRGKGIGSSLVIGARTLIRGTLIAHIKEWNVASIKVAEAAGFALIKKANDVCTYCSFE